MNGTANNAAAQLLSQLADINGLDAIGWWPLAPGWWVLLALAACLLGTGVFSYRRRQARRNSWKYDATSKLSVMKAVLDDVTARNILNELSALLRRIAIRRFSRGECAGLEGQAWVRWLKANDPHGFDWSAHEGLLTHMPYASSAGELAPAQVNRLIEATEGWVR